jgi:hypothetical protein
LKKQKKIPHSFLGLEKDKMCTQIKSTHGVREIVALLPLLVQNSCSTTTTTTTIIIIIIITY